VGKLSIYIPTWNRQHLLDKLLASIEPQLTDDVDVFVSVNKGDTSYSLPEWVQSRETRINVGGDANIIAGPTLVTGEYVWVIGDDDYLLPGAIAEVLKLIERKPGLIIHPDGKFEFGVPYGSWFPNYPAFCDAVISKNRATVLAAHTLISSNTFVRQNYDAGIAIQKIDSRYGFHYGMLANLMTQPVAIPSRPTMGYGKEASIFLHDKSVIAGHMAAYPKVIHDIFDWITATTGYPIPYEAWGRGFY
jgi:glycosyltransferase involved in cell wall biosynthesis